MCVSDDMLLFRQLIRKKNSVLKKFAIKASAFICSINIKVEKLKKKIICMLIGLKFLYTLFVKKISNVLHAREHMFPSET